MNTIFASYSDELGVATNLHVQRIINSYRYKQVFPHVTIGSPGFICTTDVFEIPGCSLDKKGSFRNTTVMSGITGFGLHLGIIDDPVKGRAEANSKTVRNRTWNWY